eukprot:520828-Amphidinium_carterae.1
MVLVVGSVFSDTHLELAEWLETVDHRIKQTRTSNIGELCTFGIQCRKDAVARFSFAVPNDSPAMSIKFVPLCQ